MLLLRSSAFVRRLVLLSAGSLLPAPALLAGATVARAEIKVGPWRPLFQGVEFAAGESDSRESALQKVFAVRIDLKAPGIEFLVTPGNGYAQLETTSETAEHFLTAHRLQLALNANFYEPCCAPGEKDLRGLAISRGTLVSPPVKTGVGSSVLLITKDNVATITTTDQPVAVENYWNAIAGSERILVDGAKPKLQASKLNTTEHPRSAVGVSRDGRYLLLLVVDGRQPGYSLGARMDSVADWLLRFGAWQGLNLDGGGSTVLECSGDKGPMTLNRVSGAEKPRGDKTDLAVVHRVQRSNGNHLGVYAKPLTAR